MTNQKMFQRARDKMFFWALAFAAFIIFVSIFKNVLFPFVLGIAVAYLLEPVMEKLVAWKLPRWAAALLILTLFFLAVFALLAVSVPILLRQFDQLVDAGPALLDRGWAFVSPYVGSVQELLGQGGLEDFRQVIKDNAANAFKIGGGVLSGLASGGMAVAGFMTTVVVTPIVAFFMMRQWPQITGWVYDLIPRDYYRTVRELLAQMDKKIAGFVRGQLIVALILGLSYAVILTLAGLNFGFIIGLFAGALNIIPLFGSTVGLLISVAVAWFQSQSIGYTGMIAGFFVAGQLLESNVITPRILGKSVGLHPLWILFALMAGGSLFGVVGMLLAVPVTAVIGVLAGFAAGRYKDSALYQASAPKGIEI